MQLKEAVTLLQKAFKFRTCHLEIREATIRATILPAVPALPDQAMHRAVRRRRSRRDTYREDIRRLIRFLDGDSKTRPRATWKRR